MGCSHESTTPCRTTLLQGWRASYTEASLYSDREERNYFAITSFRRTGSQARQLVQVDQYVSADCEKTATQDRKKLILLT